MIKILINFKQKMCTKKFIFQRQESLTASFQYPLISILFLIISSIVLSFNHIVL